MVPVQSTETQMKKGLIYTLVFIKNDNKLLLGLKKRGFAEGKWNGFGGKVENGENIEKAAIRELMEESCLEVLKLNYIGVMSFEQKKYLQVSFVHIYTSDEYIGEPKETEEMKPKWFNVDELPFDSMWPDSRVWFPYMLKDKIIFLDIKYDDDDQYINCVVTVCKNIQDVLEITKKVENTLI